ncbi:MAG: isopentenyl-diphosphate delta-isomerase [Breznakibacter sp.]
MSDRKKDHINLAFQSRIEKGKADNRFDYEPMLSAHPRQLPQPFSFAGKTMRLPVWVSSMTGGTALAGNINRNLAQACREFGMGMGLGSCRVLLDDASHLADFDVRRILGDEQPLYANLGICQLEKLLTGHQLHRIDQMVEMLRADGLIIHVNPLQEAFQPEGDRLLHSPIELIEWFLKETKLRIIVKEVGQGMGPQSLAKLMALPIEAIEFGALGGTNFSLLEMLRHDETVASAMEPFAHIGHTADEMLCTINALVAENSAVRCKQLIISGGITSVLHGHHLVKLSQTPAVFGMGAMFLKHATSGYDTLRQYVEQLQYGWMLAEAFLKRR